MKMKLSPKVSPNLKIKRRFIYAASFVALASIVAAVIFFYSNLGTPETALASAPTNISGVINSYLRVTSVTLASRQFVADNLSGSIADFAVGKKILVYQAKGATITTTNSSSYGTITSYNNAGNYEFAKVTAITGTSPYTITVASLVNSYTATDFVQLVSVPQYVDVNVTGNVTPTAWSSTQGRGGIIAFEASGTVTLGANIDASSSGFAGGVAAGSNINCPDNATYVSTVTNFGGKGEGMTAFTSGQQYARGPQANGGGGGNPYNAGGGGGSNYSIGGSGGEGDQPGGSCTNQYAGGLAGKSYPYTSSTTKLFFGGGGGAGEQNGGSAIPGGAGGGIIIIRANTVKSTCSATYGFYANGGTAPDNGNNNGGSGGGGGGAIVLDVSSYVLTCNIQASANGGNGGSVTNNATHGGGGGGGIGIIYGINATANAYKVYSSTAGTNGLDCSHCTGTTGTVPAAISSSQISITGPLPGQLSVLPIELISFTAKQEEDVVQLNWTTASEKNNDFFTVERSSNGHDFSPILTVKGAGDSKETKQYSATDNSFNSKTTYYRLKQTDYDGKYVYSKTIYIDTEVEELSIKMYPNPASEKVTITNPGEGSMAIAVHNDKGALIFEQETEAELLEIQVSDWQEGIYIVEVNYKGRRTKLKLMVKR
ncbi:MAG TPA: T9SS type A sorting domain-containing protein [Cyclobacteriaceae bacterium]